MWVGVLKNDKESSSALWRKPLKLRREKFAKVNGWILLISQPTIIFLVCTVVKLQIFSQKNNILRLVIKNLIFLIKLKVFPHLSGNSKCTPK